MPFPCSPVWLAAPVLFLHVHDHDIRRYDRRRETVFHGLDNRQQTATIDNSNRQQQTAMEEPELEPELELSTKYPKTKITN